MCLLLFLFLTFLQRKLTNVLMLSKIEVYTYITKHNMPETVLTASFNAQITVIMNEYKMNETHCL